MTSSPQRFTKKPVTIEAMQWDGTAEGATQIIDWILGNDHTASYYAPSDTVDGFTYISIHTLEGAMHTSPQDWVIEGVRGEFYPCKPDIFDATYEPEGRGDKAEVYRSGGKWRYRIIAANHRIVDSPAGQTYTTAWGAKRAARRGRPGIPVATLKTVGGKR